MRALLLNTETGDLQTLGGSLAIGDTTAQVIELVLNANRGEWKEHPTIGAEVPKMLNGAPDALWPGEVRRQLKACGITVNKMVITEGVITIE